MGPTIEEIRAKVGDVMRRRGVVRASLFGSVARGQARADSDIDILIEFGPDKTLLDLAGLRLDLSEVLGRNVDVATRGSLNPLLREQILGDLVPLL
jgi:predicted nucleotidyltransferase